jgi:hypothetical protein
MPVSVPFSAAVARRLTHLPYASRPLPQGRFPCANPFRRPLALLVCVRWCCPDWPLYQRGAAHQKNALLIDHGPHRDPRGRRSRRVPRFDPPLPPRCCVPVIRTRNQTPHQHDRSAAMYYIVEITAQGVETFLEGF